jgi:NADH dehydrogenase
MGDASRPRVVIIGGGFGGLYLARALRRAPVAVTLVDRRNHHLFQPMLYQVATAALNPSNIASPIRSILHRQRNIEVLLGEAIAIRAAEREVRLADGAVLSYDYCVLAPGARHSYFGHPEWEPLAPGLKNIEDALEIRRRILLAFERAEREPDPRKRNDLLTFVIVGGGPTGVELAGAVAEIRRYALARDFRHIDSREATVVLLEGGPRILPSYPEKLSARAKQVLRRLGVEVRENTFVTGITADAVEASGWRIPTTTVVWAAGNQASPLLATVGAPLDRQGRLVVEADCSVPGHRELFVIGDAAAFQHTADGRPLPGVAQVPMQMGKYLARTIRADLQGKPRRPFHYFDKGQLAVIGRGQALADLNRIRFNGLLAWLVWIFLHIAYLIGFRNRLLVMIDWAWSYVTYGRGARLITGEVGLGAAPRTPGS